MYYILGLAPSLFFGTRFYIQWLISERKGECFTPTIFWYLSLIGNGLSILHYFIQMQLPFLLIQTANVYISWRHLRMHLAPLDRVPFVYAMTKMVFLLSCTTLAHLLHLQFTHHVIPIFSSPVSLHYAPYTLSPFWVLVGTSGTLIFGSRFWIQWWQTEHHPKKQFSVIFWVLSIIGSLLCLIYSIKTRDTVSIVNFSFGLPPYVRNLFLLLSAKKEVSSKV
jgi:lipid-A-disaccharide synthase-like uncharacterized protein